MQAAKIENRADPAAGPCELSGTAEERDEPPCEDGQTLEKYFDALTQTHICVVSVAIGISSDCTPAPSSGCMTWCCSRAMNSRLSASIWLRVMKLSSLM